MFFVNSQYAGCLSLYSLIFTNKLSLIGSLPKYLDRLYKYGLTDPLCYIAYNIDFYFFRLVEESDLEIAKQAFGESSPIYPENIKQFDGDIVRQSTV